MFLADARGLDFLNSIATPADTVVEWLADGKDLLAWLDQAGLVPKEILTGPQIAGVPGELDVVAAQARALREWFRGFVRKHKGKPLKRSALQELEPLNQLLSRDEEFGQIVSRARGESADDAPLSGLAWQIQRRWRSPDMLLLPIARAMAELVCEDDFAE